MSSRLLFATLALAAACGGAPKRRPGDEYLRAIKVENNKALGDKSLVDGLALQRTMDRGRPPDPYLVQVDADRIRGEYLRKGYLGIDVRARVERKGDASDVIYTVEEGLRAQTKVVIEGLGDDPDLPVSKVREQLPLVDGQPFDYLTYDLAKQPLLAVVQDAGYAHARLDATVFADRANHTAIVNLSYTLGPKCKFGPIEITGVTGPLAEAVRNRLQFETGDPYSLAAITSTQRALYGLARFSTVQITPSEEVGPVVGVKVAVNESARHEIKVGGGAGLDPTAYEVRARMAYTIAGWPFPMDTFTMDLRPAYAFLRDGTGAQPRIRTVTTIRRQDLIWTGSTGEIEGGYNYLAVEAYTSYGPRARVGFSTPLGHERFSLRAGWGIERLDFQDVSPLIDGPLRMDLGLEETQRVGAFQQALVVDLRELRGFAPVGPVTLAARVRTGAFYGDVPVTERFFSGGASMHRGFGERKLSPSVTGEVDGDTRTVPYGGAAMLESNIEARIPITSWKNIGIGSVVFLDGGDVTEEYDQIDPMNLHWAVGAGLRLLTIIGPVRADLGYRLNRTGVMDPSPGSRIAFHLTLGEAF
jgi:outer membrane protein assembly factor BamA